MALWNPLSLLETLEGSVAVYAPDGTFLYVNAATERLFAASRDELIGKNIWQRFPDAVGNPFHAAFERVRVTGVSETFEHHYAPFEQSFDNHIAAIDGCIHVVATDVTQVRRAEQRLELLARASRAFAAATGLDGLFAEIVVLLADGIGDGCVMRILDADGAPLRVGAVHHRDPAVLARHRAFLNRPLANDDGLTASVLSTGKSLLVARVDPAAHRQTFADTAHRTAVDAGQVHSIVAAPLQHGDERFGILSMTRDQTPAAYDARDVALIEDLAERAAMAIVRLRALAAAESGRLRASVLATASHRFAAAPRETGAVLGVLAHAAGEALGGGALACTLSHDQRFIDASAAHHSDPEVARHLAASVPPNLPITGTLTEAMLKSPGPIRVEPARLARYARDPTSSQAIALRALQPTGFVMVPILIGGRPLGSLSVTRFGGDAISGDDEALLRELADRASLAIENVRVIEAERAARQAAEHAADRAARTRRLSDLLGSAVTANEVANALVACAGDGLGAGTANVWFLSPDGSTLELAANGAVPPALLEQFRTIPRSAVIPVNHAIDQRRVVFLADGRARLRDYPATGDGTGSGYKAWAAIPLCAGDRVFGAFSVSFVDERTFTAEDDAFFTTVGQQCAQALVRAGLLNAERAARARAELAEQAALAADRRKDEFLALLGHELRNPLAPIVTALTLIQLRGVAGIEQELDVMGRQTRHLVRLVDDLLDVSRIAQGRLELTRTIHDIATIVAEAVEMASPLLGRKRQRLVTSVSTGACFVDGDSQRLVQVFQNLLVNASKYTPEGGTITVRAHADTQQAGRMVVVVEDDGDGIEPELMGSLFDPFVQGTRTLQASRGGLGLGLTIVRRIVELHGGTVTAASAGRGRGSAFTVALPQTSASASAATAARPPPAPRAVASFATTSSVLIVDDNEDAARLLATALTRVGYRVAVAHDGPAALKMAEQLSPVAAVLDIGLPLMDGYELARRLRGMLPGVTLVAVTGYGQEADKQRATAAGFDRHLVKPVDLDALLATLADLGSGTAAAAPAELPGVG